MDYVVFYVPSRSAEARCLVIEGSEAQPCLFRNLVRRSVSMRVASFRDSAVETCLLDNIDRSENRMSIT